MWAGRKGIGKLDVGFVAPEAFIGAAVRAIGEEKAERIVREGLKQLGWEKNELTERRKGGRGKLKLAKQLRQETTMTLRWIAQRLEMGSWTYVSNLLNER